MQHIGVLFTFTGEDGGTVGFWQMNILLSYTREWVDGLWTDGWMDGLVRKTTTNIGRLYPTFFWGHRRRSSFFLFS